jgi:hypothetical protein
MTVIKEGHSQIPRNKRHGMPREAEDQSGNTGCWGKLGLQPLLWFPQEGMGEAKFRIGWSG